MDLQLGLLQNSYDFILISLDLCKTADESELGLKPKSRFEAHSRWKLAYIALLVAMELLLKEAIYRVHPNLIYVDVDSPQTTGDLLVTFRQAIARGKSLTGLSLTEREWQFLLNCTHERTDLLHCKTAIGLDKIPEKYRKLHAIYRRIHKQLTGYDLEGVLEAHRQNAEGYRYCVNCQGERHERIKYGDEPKISSDLSEEELWMKVLNPFFQASCGGCGVARGQYHSYGCRLEACPFCGNEIASCDCVEYME